MLVGVLPVGLLALIGLVLIAGGELDRAAEPVVGRQIRLAAGAIALAALLADHRVFIGLVLAVPILAAGAQGEIPAKAAYPLGVGLQGADLAVEVILGDGDVAKRGQAAVGGGLAGEHAAGQALPIPGVLAG